MKNLIVLLLVAFAFGCGKPKTPTLKEQAATDAALAWLDLVDHGKYGESWDDTAAIFKAAVPRENWVNTLKTLHSPFGKTESRTVLNREFMTSLPNAPKGQYVVIQFKTQFQNKKNAVETVTPMLDPDGKWKVSGYYVK